MAPEDECFCFLNNTTYVAICFFFAVASEGQASVL